MDWSEAHAQRFKAAMDDDFNTSVAVAELFELANAVNRGETALSGQLKALGAVLGLLQREPGEFLKAGPGGGLAEEQVAKRIAERAAAKAQKNFAQADRIRDELLKQGIVLEDGPKGTTWRRAIRSATAGAPPLYGMWTRSVPVMLLKSSAATCGAPPALTGELSLPGWLFASAISSCTEFAATDGCTSRNSGSPATCDTGTKSLTGS